MAPQFVLADGSRLDDRVGPRFAVLAADPDGIPAGLDVVTGPSVSAFLCSRGAAFAVLRPDRYVFALATNRAELRAILIRAADTLRESAPSLLPGAPSGQTLVR
jgi:3-(3-hydroxy-phenyl)propionate hydroxylase